MISILAAVAVGASVGPALAAGASQDGTAHSTSFLPFTGLDVALFAATATLLVAFGVGMARLTRPQAPPE